MASFKQIRGATFSGSKDSPTASIPFRLTDTLPTGVAGDYFDYVSSLAMNFARNTAPFYDSPAGVLYWNNIQVHENFYGLNYDISITYGKEDKQTGTYQITVSGTGGTVHVTAGTRVAVYGPKQVDNKGLIGVDGDEVKGIDWPTPVTKLTVSYRHPEAYLNAAYIKSVIELVGKTNDSTFLTYEAEEVRFSGPSFTETEAEATAQYDFDISRTQSNIIVGGITVTEKKGWHILSPVFEEAVDGGHGIRQLKCIEIIKHPGGIGTADFGDAFGWGG